MSQRRDSMCYGYKKELKYNFKEAIERVREELNKEGFGIITEIDVKATLKKKLDADFEDYLILGACNPIFAFEALKNEREIGLLLPCNVIVYVENSKVFVSVINPIKAMSIVENKNLKKFAQQINKKLKRVLSKL